MTVLGVVCLIASVANQMPSHMIWQTIGASIMPSLNIPPLLSSIFPTIAGIWTLLSDPMTKNWWHVHIDQPVSKWWHTCIEQPVMNYYNRVKDWRGFDVLALAFIGAWFILFAVYYFAWQARLDPRSWQGFVPENLIIAFVVFGLFALPAMFVVVSNKPIFPLS